MSGIWHFVTGFWHLLAAIWHYVRAPHLLLSNSFHDVTDHRLARYGAWIVDLTLLSLLLPLLMGCGAVLFGFFKPDPDDAKAKPANAYLQKHAELRARPRPPTFGLATQLNFVASVNPLELPNPEPPP
jgi:hypothetical protein